MPPSDRDNVIQANTLDPAGFRVAASDTQGHYSKFWLKMPPLMSNAISVIFSSKAFPYKTTHELVRHAVLRHLKWLESIGEVPSVSGQVEAMLEVLRQDLLQEEFLKLLTVFGERMSSYVGRGDTQEARRLLLTVMKHLDRMPDGYWKTQYDKKIDETWGYLLKGAKKMGLSKMVNE